MASLGEISSSLVTKTCSVLDTSDETVRAKSSDSSEDGSSPGSVWPPGLSYMTTDVARDTENPWLFLQAPSPLLAFAEIPFQTTEQEGCRNLFRGPFCPSFSALPTLLTVTAETFKSEEISSLALKPFNQKLLQRAVAISLFIYLRRGIGIGGIGIGLSILFARLYLLGRPYVLEYGSERFSVFKFQRSGEIAKVPPYWGIYALPKKESEVE